MNGAGWPTRDGAMAKLNVRTIMGSPSIDRLAPRPGEDQSALPCTTGEKNNSPNKALQATMHKVCIEPER